jgi:hypothetical protein
MNAAVLRNWSAWSPGREDTAAWRQWASDPEPLARDGCPEARFLPAMLRRRCSPLSRIVLTTAFECCDEGERSDVRTVFASRHGNINESIDLVESIARKLPISPTRFSHTVHNAQAGLFSIAAGNRKTSSSIAALEDTFACGYIEALTHLQREPESAVLLVVADVPLAPTFAKLIEEPAASYGVSLLLAADGTGPTISFGAAAAPDTSPRTPAWPDAAEFLRWLLLGESELVLGTGPQRWRWERAA